MGRMPIIQFHSWRPAYLQVRSYLTIAKLELTSVIIGAGQGLSVFGIIPLVLEMRT